MWLQVNQKKYYSYCSMMSTEMTTYINLLAKNNWKNESKTKEEADHNAKFLVLTALIEGLKQTMSNRNSSSGSSGGNKPKS